MLSISLVAHKDVDTHCKVYQIDKGPTDLLRHARDCVDYDLAREDEDDMN